LETGNLDQFPVLAAYAAISIETIQSERVFYTVIRKKWNQNGRQTNEVKGAGQYSEGTPQTVPWGWLAQRMASSIFKASNMLTKRPNIPPFVTGRLLRPYKLSILVL
jgi:hypothetical protein